MTDLAKHTVNKVSTSALWIFGNRRRRIYWPDGLDGIRAAEVARKDELLEQFKADLSELYPAEAA